MNKYVSGFRIDRIGYDILSVNKVIRNVYILLSMVFFFSAFMAWVSVVTFALRINIYLNIAVFFSLYYLIVFFKSNVFGLFFLFLFSGFLGYSLGPLLNSILYTYVNGQEIIILSFVLSGGLFFLLSLYAFFTKRQFNFLNSFLIIAFYLIISLAIVSYLFSILWINLLVLFLIVVFSGLYVLYYTSILINGGERNYIIATLNLYLDFFNIFKSMLYLLGFSIGRRE